jgi:ATP adenylyltransferase
MPYIQNPNKGEECVFCQIQESIDGTDNLIIHREESCYVVLNRYPYTSGHLMVVPFDHKPDLDGLSQNSRMEILKLTSQCITVLQAEYHPHGFNIGANIGSAAGAGIPRHFHFHVIPRWEGDTNFLSSIGDTRLVPEALADTYQRVFAMWKKTYTEKDKK